MNYVFLMTTIIVFSISFTIYLVQKVRDEEHKRTLLEVDLKTSNLSLSTNLEKATKEIQKKEVEINTLLNALEESSLVSITDNKGLIISINDKFCEVAKYSREELIGKNHSIINSQHHDKAFWAEMWKTIASGQIWRAEVRNKAKDGSFYWVDTVISPVLDESGKPYQYISIRQEITKKKENEEQLNLNTSMLNSAQEIAKIGGWELDLNTGITIWTKEVYNIHEVPLDFDHNKNNGIEFYHPDYRPIITKAIEESIEKKIPFDVECRFISAKNNHKWVRAFGRPTLENNQPVKLSGVFQDITQRKEHEEALKISNQRTNLATKAAKVGIWEFNLLDNTLFWDQQMYNLYNKSGEYSTNNYSFWVDSLYEEDKERMTKEVEMAISGEKDFDTEFRIHLPNDSIRHIRAMAYIVHDEQGKPTKMIGTNWDVTASKNQEQHLKEAIIEADKANKAKSEFLANMSHEIRTPLNGVIGFTDLLLNTQLNEVQKEYLETVSLSANSLLETINDILDFSKIEAGKMEVNEAKTDIHEMVYKIGNIVRHQLQSKDIELLLNILPNEIPQFIWTDEVRLRQVLINLLSNALKFTKEGEIELRIEPISKLNPNMFRFSVCDTGIGIDKDKQDKIFKAFDQADTSTTKKFGGTGLGLTISNKLLQLMNSKLQLESIKGAGSVFYFDIEFKTEKGEMNFNNNPEYGLNKALLIDDNKTNLRILSNVLAAYNISTVELDSGTDAIEYLSKKNDFDLVIVDFHMPGYNGIQTIEVMRSKNILDTAKTPVILFHSINSDEELVEKMKVNDIKYQLSKPLDLKKLNHCLNSIVGNKKYNEAEKIISRVSSNQSYEGIKLLLVEDNLINMKMAKIMVNNILPNVNLLSAANGKEGIEVFKKEGADIIITDIQMPEMNGYEFTTEVKRLAPDKSIPIIALTAGTVKGEKEKCLALGMNECLTKPVVESTLRETIGNWLPLDKTESIKVAIDNSHFNKELLLSVVKNDQLVIELLADVKSDIEENLNNIKTAFHKSKFTQVRNLAHRLKGTALSLHMPKLRKYAEHLEKSETNDFEVLKYSIEQIEQEIMFLKEHVMN
ncbi:response regulator [Fulvivirga lutimaris]|nr:response regulator [Fulvivirga lutimaris]